jgi:histidine kinase
MLSALYDITETLNHSPRTTIHRARRRSDGRAVVVKLSATDYPAQGDLTALEREHTILGELRGAGIVDVLGLEEDGARLALVLEDAGRRPGMRGQPLSLQDFLPLAVGVTRALASVHARGIVHRDINPDNIALASDGKTVKLIDFSIAIRAAERSEPGNTSLTGTLAYLSPEQTGRMNRPVDHRSDLYSLGITFFELLSGAVPFQAADAIGYVHCHLTKAPPPLPSNVPEVLAQIVARLMAKDPDARYQTATGVLHDLEECQRRWSASADIGLFPLGARDRSSRLEVAKALVERQALQAQVVEMASDRLVVLSGAEGVGKSALLRAVGAALAPAATVVFASCEAGGHIPLGVVRSALAELASLILASTENELLDWRTELRSAVGNNGHVLLDLVPELAPVLGEQPPVPELPPREAAARRTHVFRAFLRAATARRPLVIALDALQWVDAPTTELLVNIMTASDLPGLTILGALRDGEASPFDAAFAELTTRRPEAVARVAIPALSVAGVSGIVAATLAHSEDAVASLAQVCLREDRRQPAVRRRADRAPLPRARAVARRRSRRVGLGRARRVRHPGAARRPGADDGSPGAPRALGTRGPRGGVLPGHQLRRRAHRAAHRCGRRGRGHGRRQRGPGDRLCRRRDLQLRAPPPARGAARLDGRRRARPRSPRYRAQPHR